MMREATRMVIFTKAKLRMDFEMDLDKCSTLIRRFMTDAGGRINFMERVVATTSKAY